MLTESEAKNQIFNILNQTNIRDPMDFARNIIKNQAIQKVNNAILQCNDCKINSKCKTIGYGNPNASVLIISDYVIEDQAALNKPVLTPFEGTKESVWINNILDKLRINKNELYWMNSVNCFTTQILDNTEFYRCPNSREIDRCSVFMKYIVDVIHPSMIILMGAIALNCFKSASITKEHGKWVNAYTIPAMPVYSPAHIRQAKGKSPDDVVKKMQEDFINDLTAAFNYIKGKFPGSNIFI